MHTGWIAPAPTPCTSRNSDQRRESTRRTRTARSRPGRWLIPIEQHRLAPIRVGELAEHDRHRRLRQQIGREDPGVQMQITKLPGDLRHRRRDDGRLDRDRERGGHDGRDDEQGGACSVSGIRRSMWRERGVDCVAFVPQRSLAIRLTQGGVVAVRAARGCTTPATIRSNACRRNSIPLAANDSLRPAVPGGSSKPRPTPSLRAGSRAWPDTLASVGGQRGRRSVRGGPA